MNSRRICCSITNLFSVWTLEDLEIIRSIFKQHGSSVKKLFWNNYENFNYSEKLLAELLNFFPKLEELSLSSWENDESEDHGEEIVLNLKNLKNIEFRFCNFSIIRFFFQNMPKNTVRSLKIQGGKIPMQLLTKLVAERQTEIQTFDFEGLTIDESLMSQLKLSKLRLILNANFHENQGCVSIRRIMKKFIKSQPNLRSLDILNYNDLFDRTVDDDLFLEICELRSLEELVINFTRVSPECAQRFAKLKKLKSLRTLTRDTKSAFKAFNEVSLIKNHPLEKLEINIWGPDLKSQILKQFGENYSLKFLNVGQCGNERLNFFMTNFPSLESLKIRFSGGVDRINFQRAYEDDGFVHNNMKKIEAVFNASGHVNVEVFFKMFRAFPNLDFLKIRAELVYNDGFFKKLRENLGKIRKLSLSVFFVEADVIFSDETIGILREMSEKLRYCEFQITRQEEVKFGQIGNGNAPECNVNFDPLTEQLKNYFKIKESLNLDAGFDALTLSSGQVE